jgi:hypothetical protein
MSYYRDIRELIARVRRRWRGLRLMRALVRASLGVLLVLGVTMVLSRWTWGAPAVLAAIGLTAAALALIAILWSLLPLRRRPDDRQVARFIEERDPSLDDRLVTAVDVAHQPSTPAGFAEPVLADAARRAREVNVDAIISGTAMRRAAVQAAAAIALLLTALVATRQTLQQTADAAALTLFPARVGIEVAPGNARIKAGTPIVIEARLVGNSAPVAAQVQIADGEAWRGIPMQGGAIGKFRADVTATQTSFRYRVVAGAVTSPAYDISVVRPPRVTRIDVDYAYPAGLRLPPRTERDAGDIYAPAGTDVRLHVITDQPAAAGRMALSGGRSIDLQPARSNELTTGLKVTEDGSYRLAVADAEGLSSAGDTEYFIRVLEDRAPDVRVTRPASDRSVTRLEEIDIEAQAEDDYGIDRLDLVYSVRGEAEKVMPFRIPRHETAVSGHQTLFLEDLDVQPGDFVSYYVRARDLTRGTRPNEARSDIFFLEVKPYDQEFALAQSQAAAAGGGGRGSIDELVAAQKEIIVATWKLDRRAQAARGAKSEQDIRSVSKAEAELKTRVEQASSAFRETAMRDPRRRAPRGGRGAPPPGPEPLRAGETMPEEDEMTAAAAAMGKAVTSLDALKTAEARGPEMEALNHLLRAQAEVKKREVTRQQSGSGNASNRSNYDLSTLFDRELQKQQQTNYENRSTAEQRNDPNQSALDRVRELARRQDELLKKQQELARNRQNLTEEELRRQLERLTREQSDLRQEAEQLAKQMASPSSQGSQGSRGSETSQGAKSSQGSRGSDSSRSPNSPNGQQMRDVSEAMRSATNDLRRRDQSQAAASAGKALERLRELERQLQTGRPDDKRRALGEMQLEARQLADAQRQLASELSRTQNGEPARDALRRMAGDEERLAERARRLQDALARQSGSAGVARELERQKLADRMRQSAEAMRAAAGRGSGTQRGNTAPPGSTPGLEEAKRQTPAQQELARALDDAADKIAASGDGKDAETGKLSNQLARVQELQDRINQLTGQMKQLSGENGQRGTASDQNGSRGQAGSNGQQSDGRGQSSGNGTSASRSPGESGRAGQGQGGGGNGAGSEAARLRDEVQRTMQETRELMEQLRRQDPTFSRGGAGFTFEGQGMTTSAPGTEAFKQDFAKWDDLRRQATQALEAAQTTLSKKLKAKESKERLAAGADDKAPPEYQKQVDEYFKAIAAKKKGG